MERPIKFYLERADELAQRVINGYGQAWNAKIKPGPKYTELMNLMTQYTQAKGTAAENDARLAFATAYKTFEEEWEAKAERGE